MKPIGRCAMAPVTVVEETVQGKVTPTRVKGILLPFELKKGARQNSDK
jgi:NADH:ubiquinone oxidoreductase subunit E